VNAVITRTTSTPRAMERALSTVVTRPSRWVDVLDAAAVGAMALPADNTNPGCQSGKTPEYRRCKLPM